MVDQPVNPSTSIQEKLSPPEHKRAETRSLVENGYRAEAPWLFPRSKPPHLAIESGHDDNAR